MLICVLRIGGIDLQCNEAIKLLSAPPYRKDNRGQHNLEYDVFHYDVCDATSKQELMSEIQNFLQSEDDALSRLLADSNITMREIDVGISMPATLLSRSLKFESELIDSLARFKLSLSMSVYKSSDEAEQPTPPHHPAPGRTA